MALLTRLDQQVRRMGSEADVHLSHILPHIVGIRHSTRKTAGRSRRRCAELYSRYWMRETSRGDASCGEASDVVITRWRQARHVNLTMTGPFSPCNALDSSDQLHIFHYTTSISLTLDFFLSPFIMNLFSEILLAGLLSGYLVVACSVIIGLLDQYPRPRSDCRDGPRAGAPCRPGTSEPS